jgi:hypothetical protein
MVRRVRSGILLGVGVEWGAACSFAGSSTALESRAGSAKACSWGSSVGRRSKAASSPAESSARS